MPLLLHQMFLFSKNTLLCMLSDFLPCAHYLSLMWLIFVFCPLSINCILSCISEFTSCIYWTQLKPKCKSNVFQFWFRRWRKHQHHQWKKLCFCQYPCNWMIKHKVTYPRYVNSTNWTVKVKMYNSDDTGQIVTPDCLCTHMHSIESEKMYQFVFTAVRLNHTDNTVINFLLIRLLNLPTCSNILLHTLNQCPWWRLIKKWQQNSSQKQFLYKLEAIAVMYTSKPAILGTGKHFSSQKLNGKNYICIEWKVYWPYCESCTL